MIPGSGNHLVDAQEEINNIKPCPRCEGEEGQHYCLCNKEISAEACADGRGCPDCR